MVRAKPLRTAWSTRPLVRRKTAPSTIKRRDQLRIWDVALVRLRRLLVVERRPEQVEALLGDEAGQQPGGDAYRSEDQLHLWRATPETAAETGRLLGGGHRPRPPREGLHICGCEGARVEDAETLGRIRELAIPPAWEEVWVCPDPFGHIQATGIDAAGRKQYLYHEAWQRRAAARKFESAREFAAALPRLRRAASRDLAREGMPRERALACAVRLLDLGFFRVGGELYAETNESYGVATILREHVSVSDGEIVFDFPAKSGQRRVQSIRDREVRGAIEAMRRRRSGPDDLLVFRERDGWRDVRSEDVNEYIQEKIGEEFSAKDFRTWHGTVLAAAELAAAGRPAPRAAPSAPSAKR